MSERRFTLLKFFSSTPLKAYRYRQWQSALMRSTWTFFLILTIACGSSSGQMSSDGMLSEGDHDLPNSHPHKHRKHKKPQDDWYDEETDSKNDDEAQSGPPPVTDFSNIAAFVGLDPDIIKMFMSGQFDLTRLKPEQLAQIQGFINKAGGLDAMMAAFGGMVNSPLGGGWPPFATSTSTVIGTSTTTAAHTATTTQTATATQSTTQTATLTQTSTATQTATGIAGIGECPAGTYCMLPGTAMRAYEVNQGSYADEE